MKIYLASKVSRYLIYQTRLKHRQANIATVVVSAICYYVFYFVLLRPIKQTLNTSLRIEFNFTLLLKLSAR